MQIHFEVIVLEWLRHRFFYLFNHTFHNLLLLFLWLGLALRGVLNDLLLLIFLITVIVDTVNKWGRALDLTRDHSLSTPHIHSFQLFNLVLTSRYSLLPVYLDLWSLIFRIIWSDEISHFLLGTGTISRLLARIPIVLFFMYYLPLLLRLGLLPSFPTDFSLDN